MMNVTQAEQLRKAIENLVDAHTPRVYCSSPSGAFVD